MRNFVNNIHFKLIFCSVLVSCSAGQKLKTVQGPPGLHPALNASNAIWDEGSKSISITRSVTFSKGKNAAEQDTDTAGFYWNVPVSVKKIIIGKNVTIAGGFRANGNLEIVGADHDSSIIYGTLSRNWSYGPNGINDSKADGNNCNDDKGDDYVHDCTKWNYGAVSVNRSAPAEAVLMVKSLKVENPRTYAITTMQQKVVLDDVYIVNTRTAPDYQSNSDGFGGGKGWIVRNCKIDTWDDGIKLYRDMTVENTTIVHNGNGAPFQLGWGGKANETFHHLKNVLVIANNKERSNLALFSASLTQGKLTCNVAIDGLKAVYSNDQTLRGAEPLPLFLVKSEGAVLNLTAVPNSAILLQAPQGKGGPGKVNVSICGTSEIRKEYRCGNPDAVTGCNW